jgi:putative tricarboxylic transport membrane protein
MTSARTRLPARTRLRTACGGALASTLLIVLGVARADAPIGTLTILVPAERGGGFDLTARAMADVLQRTHLVESTEIVYSPGAGGLIGLAQFVASHEGDRDTVFVGGKFTVGASIPNRATVSLLDATPLARLTWDSAMVGVPADSRIRSAGDLIEAFVSAPDSIAWVGGSRGGVDELLLVQLASALNVPPARLHYTPMPGGGEVGSALARGAFTAGISGYSEFEQLVHDGKLRILAVAAKDPYADVDAPTFAQLGIRVDALNWRGVFAPPGIGADRASQLSGLIEKMVRSEAWQEQLRVHHWEDAYLAGPEFEQFVRAEYDSAQPDNALSESEDASDRNVIVKVLLRRYRWAVALGVVSLLLGVVLYFQRSRARHREHDLRQAFDAAAGEANLRAEELERAFAGIHAQIEREFDKWSLSAAERDIALLMLKGLRLKEIAACRGTTERTVRQQAQAVYKKAGISGRSNLAAYFIEDFMQSMELRQAEVVAEQKSAADFSQPSQRPH